MNRASHNRCHMWSHGWLGFGSIKISLKPIYADILIWSAMFHLINYHVVLKTAFLEPLRLRCGLGWSVVQIVIGLSLYRLIALALFLLLHLASLILSPLGGWVGGWIKGNWLSFATYLKQTCGLQCNNSSLCLI